MARPTYPPRDKVVLITGAARGIGAAVARRLVDHGAYVSLVGLEPAELERLAEELGDRAIWLEADVSDREAIEAAATETAERLGGIDVVVANAGIGVGGSVRLVDPDAFDRVIEVNLLGVWRTVRACLPQVIERRGYVLSIASVAAALHLPGMASYAASKAGVEAFSDSLRAELRHLGVDVGVAYFSFLDTDLVRASDQLPAYGGARKSVKGPAGRTYPVSAAADAVLAAITRRARVVVVPGWVRGLLALRGLVGSPFERASAKRFAEIEALAEEEVRLHGDGFLSQAIGPGGAAAMAARDRR